MVSRGLQEAKRKIKVLYSWHKQGRFWRQVKIKLFRDYEGFKLFFPFTRFQKIVDNKIVCASYSGIYHSGNPAYIIDEMIKQHTPMDIVWLVDKEHLQEVPSDTTIRLVDIYSFRAMYELASAKIWIDNSRKSVYVPKKDGQFYLQTWHGGIALKTIEADAVEYLTKKYIEKAKIDSKNIDLMISNSKFCTDLYRRAFWYDGEIIEKGLPRNDFLIHHFEFDKNALKKRLRIPLDSKVILYAPTFRADKNDSYLFDFSKIIDATEKTVGKSVTVIIKHHPNIRMITKAFSYIGNVIDVTDYSDIQELYLISDFLITDYSSTMFEFGMLKKPVFLYVNDWEDYKKNDRAFYFTFDELPFMTAYSLDQLVEQITLYNSDIYLSELNNFYQSIGLCETGYSANIIASFLIDILKK